MVDDVSKPKLKGQGGAGRGQGRKKYKKNKKTLLREKLVTEALESGLTPLTVMLDNMRFAHEQAAGILEDILRDGQKTLKARTKKLASFKEVLRFRAMAGEAAKDAAPYIHPKLQSIDVGNKNDKPLKLIIEGGLPDDEPPATEA